MFISNININCCASVGQTLTDVFTVLCLNWRNCIGIQTGLSYAYISAPKDTPAATPLYRGSNKTVDLRLPAGDSNDEFRNQVTVVVSDGIGESEDVHIYPVTVSIESLT